MFLKVAFTAGVILSFLADVYGEDMKNQQTIRLPQPDVAGKMPLESTISGRRSIRNFSDKALSLKQVGQLLWSAQGITDRKRLRAAPSAGALFPLEVYVAKEDGLYRYIPDGHILQMVSARDIRPGLQKASLMQAWVKEAPVDIIICAVYKRVTSRYGDRGIRYTDMEAGHVAQNIHLQAVALGLGSVPIGAFDDRAVSAELTLADEEAPLYIIPVGHIK